MVNAEKQKISGGLGKIIGYPGGVNSKKINILNIMVRVRFPFLEKPNISSYKKNIVSYKKRNIVFLVSLIRSPYYPFDEKFS